MKSDIGLTIKRIRNANDLLQEQMAKDLKVSGNYISLIENGRKKPGMPFLRKVSKKYNVPLLFLNKEDFLPVAKNSKERALRKDLESLLGRIESNYFNEV